MFDSHNSWPAFTFTCCLNNFVLFGRKYPLLINTIRGIVEVQVLCHESISPAPRGQMFSSTRA